MPDEAEGRSESGPRGVQGLVLKNALFSSVAQAASIPLSILLNASMARYLGAGALGYMYLATTFNSFGFLAVDWGQAGALPALVATDRSRAGKLLGTSLAWRVTVAVAVGVTLSVLCRILGYGPEVRLVVGILSVGYLASSIVNGCQDTILGFERTDVGAIRQFTEGLCSVLIVVPIVMLGGKLPVALVGCIIPTLLVFIFVWRSLRRIGVRRLSFDRDSLKTLIERGTPFVFFNLAMVLQPNIDAVFLSKFTPADVVGWHAAARKLIGLLVFPVTALIGALYPTLCRLFATDHDGYIKASAGALRGTSLLVMPIALGCALFPDIGVAIYSRATFARAEENLRVLAVFLFLMYFTMPLGVCLLAGGRQRAWAVVQSICVAVSAALDPILVPWFQRRTGNGGLGICVAAVVSEVLVVICGAVLAPRGLFGRPFWRSLVPVLLSGVAMAIVARLLHGISSFLVAPIAVGAYAGTLWMTGGVDKEVLRLVGSFVQRKLAGRRRNADGA